MIGHNVGENLRTLAPRAWDQDDEKCVAKADRNRSATQNASITALSMAARGRFSLSYPGNVLDVTQSTVALQSEEGTQPHRRPPVCRAGRELEVGFDQPGRGPEVFETAETVRIFFSLVVSP